MSNKDWTDKLPELFEGYTEAEPEGLWDAVAAGVGQTQRRIAAWWWYAGGLLAAAAVAVFVLLLWPVAPAADGISIAPGDAVLADVPTQVEEGVGSETAATLGMLRGRGPTHTMGGVERSETVSDPTPSSIPTHPSAENGQSGLTVGSDNNITGQEEQVVTEIKPEIQETQKQEESLVVEEESWEQEEKAERKVGRKPKVRAALEVMTTGYMGQTASKSFTGYGVPTAAVVPSAPALPTKGLSSGGSVFSDLGMISRNKTTTTETSHSQTARFAFGLKLNFLPRWGMETGLMLSTLNSISTTYSGSNHFVTEKTVEYLGVPLYLHYDAVEWQRLSLYIIAGPMYEFATSMHSVSTSYMNGKSMPSATDDTLTDDSIWSANAGVGLQLAISDRSALFVQPGFSYHFKGSAGLETFYSAHPASFNITLGYRLSLF